jgi:hypothetical protein
MILIQEPVDIVWVQIKMFRLPIWRPDGTTMGPKIHLIGKIITEKRLIFPSLRSREG